MLNVVHGMYYVFVNIFLVIHYIFWFLYSMSVLSPIYTLFFFVFFCFVF